MGSYQNIYIGPYLSVKNKVVDSTNTTMVCSNTDCDKHNKKVDSKFCPQCGQPPIKKVDPVKKNYDANDALNKFDEEYHNQVYFPHNGGTDMFKDRMLILPNDSEGRPLEIDIDEDRSGEYPLFPDDVLSKIPEDLGWFETKFKKYVDHLREEFGPENCNLKWGIVIHYS